MRYVWCVLLCLATSVVSLAAPPKVIGVTSARVGEIVEVEVEADKAGKIGFHNPYDVTSLFVREAVPRREGTLCLLIQPKVAGVYRLTLWTAGETTGTTLAVDASGQAIPVPPGPGPGPGPGPQPNPNPQPNPVPITVTNPWVIVVEETSVRTLDTARVLNDLNFWRTLPVDGYRFYDNNSPDAKLRKYDQLAASTGISLPVMMIVDGKGNLAKAKALPKSTQEVRDFVKEVTGK